MPSAVAQAELNRQIEDAVVELEAASAQGRVNIFLARMAGGVAALVSRHDLTSRLETIISGLTVEDWLSGSITNIDRRTIDPIRTIKLPSSDETARAHPACDDDSILAGMTAQDDSHVQLCLHGDFEGAARAATTPLALEDIGCTLAAMGQFDQATAFVNGRSMSVGARANVRFVILLEKCRREFLGFEDAIREANLEGYARLHVALALAGRLPWVGYPHSDW